LIQNKRSGDARHFNLPRRERTRRRHTYITYIAETGQLSVIRLKLTSSKTTQFSDQNIEVRITGIDFSEILGGPKYWGRNGAITDKIKGISQLFGRAPARAVPPPKSTPMVRITEIVT